MSTDPDEAVRAARIAKYLEGVPVSSLGIVRRALGKTGGRQNAIKAKCLHCSNWQREEISYCRVFTCPLHPWRPFQPIRAADVQPEPQP